jgi:hypothetical protein
MDMSKQTTIAPKRAKLDIATLQFDWSDLMHMLSFKRADGSAGEQAVIDKYIRPICGKPDAAGNFVHVIGDSRIMWSSHTDTVHRSTLKKAERQRVLIDDTGMVWTPDGTCLGADDGAGIAIMLHMIAANVPGVYVFHRGEEIGAHGSSYIAKIKPDYLTGLRACIAFDRYGTTDVITHQGSRSASDAFALSLAKELNSLEQSFALAPCANGVFTDSANYTDVVGECTNLAVGYMAHHTARETLDLPFLDKLTNALIRMDQTALVFEREPGEHDDWYGDNWRYSPAAKKTAIDWPDAFQDSDNFDALVEMIQDNPVDVANILLEYGVDAKDLANELYERGASVPRRMFAQ